MSAFHVRSPVVSHTRRCWSHGLFLLLLGLVLAPATQALTRTRVTSPTGRPVLEVRLGTQPNTNLVRTVAITSGPLGQTTSLVVNTAMLGDLIGSNPPPLTWTVLVSSGQLYSLGGGCSRGNQVDFPYINAGKLHIARFVGTTVTIVTATINSADLYQSVNCVVAPDQQSTLYILSNQTAQRMEIWRERTVGNFVRERQSTIVQRLPFNGGVRPVISRVLRPGFVPSPSAIVPPIEFDAYFGDVFRVAYHTEDNGLRIADWKPAENSLLPVRTFTVTARPAPFEIALVSNCVLGDIDGNGTLDLYVTEGAMCPLGMEPTPAGPGGALGGYSFTSPAMVLAPRKRRVLSYAETQTVVHAGQPPVSTPSAHSGIGGPFAVLPVRASLAFELAFLAAGPDDAVGGLRYALQLLQDPDAMLSNSFEDEDIELLADLMVLSELFDLADDPD